MVYGAVIDACTLQLPDLSTLGATIIGLIAQAVFDPGWNAAGLALLRAISLGILLELFRESYFVLRHDDGLGFGDVKLATAIGAWLHVSLIPYCFLIASFAGLAFVGFSSLRGKMTVRPETKLPFGLFLCPTLWFLTFFSFLTE